MDKKLVSMCNKVIEYGFYSLIFFSPLIFNRATYELFEFPKMIFVYAAATVITTSFIIKSLINSKVTLKRTPLDLPILIFLIATMFSTVFSLDRYTSLFGYYTRFHGGLLSLLSYLSLYYIFTVEFNFERMGRTYFHLLFSSTSIISIYAVIQRLGIDNKYWVQDSQARVFSTLGQPNWLAAYLSMIIPILLALILIEKQKSIKLIFSSITLLSVLAFYFTFSRSGYLALLIVLFIFLVLIRFKAKIIPINWMSGKLRWVLPAAFVLFALLSLTSNQLSGRAIETAKDIKLTEGGSTGEIRLLVWQGTLNLFQKSPSKRQIFGYGPDTFAYAFLPFRPQRLNQTSEWDFLYNKPHNEFLDILANLGLFGLLAFALLIVSYCVWNLKILPKRRPDTHKQLVLLGIFSGWISLLITSFFGFIVVPTALLFWLFPALSFSIAKDSSPGGITQKRISRPIQLSILVLPFLGVYFLLFISKLYFADVAYSKGRDLRRNGLYEAAEVKLKEATNLNPREPRYKRDLAQTYATLATISDDDEQMNLYLENSNIQAKAAFDLNPYNSLTLRSVINTYFELGKIDSRYLKHAEEYANFATAYIPTDPVLRYIKGKILLAEGGKEESLGAFNEAIKLKEDYRNAKYAKGLVLADLGHHKEAAKIMEEIGELDKANEYKEKIP